MVLKFIQWINVDGYIEESTRGEIEYAKQIGKEIIYLESI